MLIDRKYQLTFIEAWSKRHGTILLLFHRCLSRHALYRLLRMFGIPKVIMADRFQISVKFVNQRDTGGNVQLDDIGIGHVVEILDQRTQAVPVRCYQHALSGTNRRRDPIMPTTQKSRQSVFQTFRSGNLFLTEFPVTHIVSGMSWVFLFESRRTNVVASPSQFDLRLTELFGRLGFVQPLQSAVMPFV